MSTPFQRASKLRGGHVLTREMLRILRPFWKLILLSAVAGSVGGMAMAWSLSIINGALASATASGTLIAFAGLCALGLAGQLIAGIGNSVLGQKIVALIRKDVCGRILRAPLTVVEQRKSHRLFAVLNGDVEKIAELGHHFAGYTIALAVVGGCLTYLLILSPLMLVLAVVLIAVGAVLNMAAMERWLASFDKARGLEDDLQKHYRAIIEGAKELRLNRKRRLLVEQQGITPVADRIAILNSRAFATFWAVDTVGVALLMSFVGVTLALRPFLHIGTEALTGFVIVMLFVKGPVEELASALPVFGQAQIAFRRVAALTSALARDGEEGGATSTLPFEEALSVRDLRYSFPGRTAAPFAIDVPELTIRHGEITFIVGGNGSGKTTFIKLLLGLYQPQAGRIHVDRQPVTPDVVDEYRQLFSGVFADYHLFDDVSGSSEATARVNAWLHRLDLAAMVALKDGVFTTTDLSTGQRKRLALIQAILEDRPILMFDEWAADQDPEFRRLFYTVLLPELREAGKTLIVVSHDDRYFHLADQVIHLEHGKVARLERPLRATDDTSTKAVMRFEGQHEHV